MENSKCDRCVSGSCKMHYISIRFDFDEWWLMWRREKDIFGVSKIHWIFEWNWIKMCCNTKAGVELMRIYVDGVYSESWNDIFKCTFFPAQNAISHLKWPVHVVICRLFLFDDHFLGIFQRMSTVIWYMPRKSIQMSSQLRYINWFRIHTFRILTATCCRHSVEKH